MDCRYEKRGIGKVNIRNLERACRGSSIPCLHKMTFDEAKKGVGENHEEKKMIEGNTPHLRTMHLK